MCNSTYGEQVKWLGLSILSAMVKEIFIALNQVLEIRVLYWFGLQWLENMN